MFGLMQRYHKAVLFYDPYGRAGKGTACDMLAAVVPTEFVTEVASPFNWNNEYYLATLARSRLNLVGELPENTPLPAAEFKTVTGGDILTGRHPRYRRLRSGITLRTSVRPIICRIPVIKAMRSSRGGSWSSSPTVACAVGCHWT